MGLNKRLIGAGATAGAGGLTPSEHFGVVLYEGDGSSSHSINGGKFGAGAATNGSNSNLTYPEETFDINKSHTVSGWVNLSVLANEDMLFYNHDSNVRLNSNYSVKYRRNLVNTAYDIDSSTTLSTNTWYHIVTTFDTTSGMTLYINGSSEGTDSYTGNASNHSSDYGLMYRADNGGQRTKGKIDQVRIFQKALTSSEVSTLYAETAATVESLDPLSEDTTDTLQVLGDTSCIATYRFENDEVDLSGNYDGTGTAIQYAAGRYGQGVDVNNDGVVTIPANITNINDHSLSVWFNTSRTSGTQTVFEFNTGNRIIFRATSTDSNKANFGGGGWFDHGISFSADKWYHLVITFKSGSPAKIYVNGSLEHTTGNISKAADGSANYLGANNASGGDNLLGTLDQFRVFNKEISAAEVTTLYNENPLVASYRFEGNANDDMRTYDGTATNVTYEYGLGFTPDFVWTKRRNQTRDHNIYDSTRGVGNYLTPNNDGQQYFHNTLLTSFDTGGFTLGSAATVNADGDDYVAWCFKANGGTTSSNTDGAVTTTVQANTDAGFSIVSFSGTGSQTTFGHGLGEKPDVVIIKRLDSTDEWSVYHDLVDGSMDLMYLNLTAANSNSSRPLFTSSVFYWVNSGNYIAYAFKSIDGFSKFGTYNGNGSANGPIVETGFEPAFLMVKGSSNTGSWLIFDNKRNTTNPRTKILYADSSTYETTNSNIKVDFLSNGFQLVGTDTDYNGSGRTYIYMAFAADPDTEAPTVAKSFSTVTYDGTGVDGLEVTGLGFKPGMVWIKNRDLVRDHNLADIVQGVSKEITPNTTEAQESRSITSFDSDGFTLDNASGNYNDSSSNYVAWAWKADDNEPTIYGGDAVAIYKFDDDVNDVTGTYNGTASNVTFGTGKYGNCAISNGSNSSITTSYNPDDTKAFSWSSWINVTNVATAPNDNIFGTMESSSPFNGVAIFLDVNDIALSTGGSNRGNIVTNVSTGTWYHVAVTYNGNGTFKTYKDGSLVSTISQTPVNGGSFWFGDGGPSSWNAFDGKLDQIRLYEELLSDQQISNLYNETASTVDDVALSGGDVIISANANAGFSIVKYEGIGADMKVPHGLSSAPEMLIVKGLETTNDWSVLHKDGSDGDFLQLNGTSAESGAGSIFGSTFTRPTATVFTVGNTGETGTADKQYIAYCFHSVSGYQKFGSYAGSGSAVTVTTGFKPDYVLIKRTNNSSRWIVLDSKRNFFESYLDPSDSLAEQTDSEIQLSVTSTTFVLPAGSNSAINTSGSDYIYWAVAKNVPSNTTLVNSFKTVTYTGNSGAQTITGVGFKPDLVWTKARNQSGYSHFLADSIRGGTKVIQSNSNAAEITRADNIQSFDSDGFTLAGDGTSNYNSTTYAAWCWKAGNTWQSNIDGEQGSIVNANTANGFSVVKWTGNGSSAKTLGHGLGAIPEMVIVKKLGATQDWWVYNKYVDATQPARYWLSLNDSDARGDNGASGGSLFNSTSPTATVFSTGTTLQESSDYIAYAFHSVSGYSKISSYSGNGGSNSITGLGFQPDWIMIKETDGVDSWEVYDSVRGDDKVLYPNGSNAEGTGSNFTSFDSDGFTVSSATSVNENGKTYIYMAFKMN